MDSIFVRGLRVQALIGIWEWERRNRQTVLIDLEMAVDTRKAARSDRIGDTVNYSDVIDRVQALAEGTEYRLVESLGEAIARLTVRDFGVGRAQVTVTKPGAIRDTGEVGVTLIRERADYDA